MKSWAIQFDRDYGSSRRTGWSIIYDRRMVAELEPHLIVALWKAWRNVRRRK